MLERTTVLQHIVTEMLVLDVTTRSPKKLDAIVERAQKFRGGVPHNEVLRAVDYLESRRLLEMRTPNNKTSKTLFMKKTSEVPDDERELIWKLMTLHGIKRN